MKAEKVLPVFSQYQEIEASALGMARSGRTAGSKWSSGVRMEALANLAHELRTPVQVLLGCIDLLRDESAPASEEEAREIIDRMNSNVHDLAQTVENLMDIATATAGAEAPVQEDIDLDELFAELQPALDASNRGKCLEIAVDLADAPRIVHSQRRPLRSIITNLAHNAIKFTAKGSVTIRCREVGRPGVSDMIEIEVHDTGPGMDPALLDRAFAKFVQLSASSVRRYRGMGLGLAVVRRNASALGARVEVWTAPGYGASFRITIPCPIVRRRCRFESIGVNRRSASRVFDAGRAVERDPDLVHLRAPTPKAFNNIRGSVF